MRSSSSSSALTSSSLSTMTIPLDAPAAGRLWIDVANSIEKGRKNEARSALLNKMMMMRPQAQLGYLRKEPCVATSYGWTKETIMTYARGGRGGDGGSGATGGDRSETRSSVVRSTISSSAISLFAKSDSSPLLTACQGQERGSVRPLASR